VIAEHSITSADGLEPVHCLSQKRRILITPKGLDNKAQGCTQPWVVTPDHGSTLKGWDRAADSPCLASP
jgi:hypothetical protein